MATTENLQRIYVVSIHGEHFGWGGRAIIVLLFLWKYHCCVCAVVCMRQSCWSYVAPSSVLNAYYDKICLKFASPLLIVCSLHGSL